MAREPRQPVLLGDARQCRRCSFGLSAPEPRTSTSRPLSVGGDMDVERLLRGLQRLGDRPGRRRARRRAPARAPGSGRWRRCGARAAPRSRLRARRACRAAHAAPRGGGPCRARRSSGVDRRDRGRHASSTSTTSARFHSRYSRQRPVLQRAAAADAEMLDRRCDALGARADRCAAAGGGRDGRRRPRPSRFRPAACRAHRPARRRVGDAVAAMPEARDGQLFGHAPALAEMAAAPQCSLSM